MRQTRLSLGCRDWQRVLNTIGATAGAVLLKLRLLMRDMGTAEVSLTAAELATALHLTEEQVRDGIRAIVDNQLLTATEDTWGVIKFVSDQEAAAMRERAKKAAKKAARPVVELTARLSGSPSFCAGEIPRGNSPEAVETNYKPYKREEVVMVDGIFPGELEKKEKHPRTPIKEKSLTESTGRASMHEASLQPELPADDLEAEFTDALAVMSPSLRKTVRNESADVREAFYLYIRRKRKDEGDRFGFDAARCAWLAAKRIPEERRADSIIAATMGGWKTIRDCGSGVYFEKETGRVVSLVRGPVEYQTPQTASRKANADLAVKLAQSMRRA